MEKEFIPYEQALALKELGFDEECLAIYTTYSTVNKRNYKNPVLKIVRQESQFTQKGVTKAPLYQQAFRWFREKYNLFGEINLTTKQEDVKEFEFFVLDINEPLFESDDYKKYKEAELACLEKLIEIVEEKNKKS